MNRFFCILTLLSWSIAILPAQDIKIGIQDTLYSDLLKEDRPIKIFLPASYAKYSSVPYPVTYVLDGDFLFPAISGMVEYMSKTGQLPEMILVCISNTSRTRDFTPTHSILNYEGDTAKYLQASGGGPEFLSFLNKELIPYINQNYRTNSYNSIVGRSFGGLIAGYDFLQSNSQLNSYLLIDPSFWWDDQWVIQQVKSKTINSANKRLYLSCSDNFKYSDYINQMRISQEAYYLKLKEAGMPPSKLKIDYFEEDTHGTVTIPSLHKGLLFLFDGYYLEGMKYKKAGEIIEHFTTFKQSRQAEFPPLEGMINWLASLQEKAEDSHKLYQLNAQNFPESLNVQFKLAQSFEKLEQADKAVLLYQNILKEDKGHQASKERLKILKEK